MDCESVFACQQGHILKINSKGLQRDGGTIAMIGAGLSLEIPDTVGWPEGRGKNWAPVDVNSKAIVIAGCKLKPGD